MTVVTRFAPSPTGWLHIGGARTALFNYLYARHMGGKFLLRIEDTDRERSTQEAVDIIINSMDWLGLTSDEPPVFQSDRAARHVEVAHEMVERGFAYYDFTTKDELEKLRADWLAKNPKTPFRYLDNPWRNEPTLAGFMPEGPPCVRLKAPREGQTFIDDMVQGVVRVNNVELDDMILLRSDRTPTYMLAVVVDDHDAGVTHIIRGDDHLNNAFRQLPIYRAMGWEEPTYAHIPLIYGEDGKKLSKRNGAAGVDEYQDMGILPEAMLNYLCRLGWGHGDDELFSMKQAVKWFDIKDVGRNPARVDSKKLKNISGHYIREAEPARLLGELRTMLGANGIELAGSQLRKLLNLIPALQPRSANLVELYHNAEFLWAKRPIHLDHKAREMFDPYVVREFYVTLEEQGTDSNLNELVKQFAEESTIPLRDVAMSLRIALTGKTVSPPIDAVMYALGTTETLARLKDRF